MPCLGRGRHYGRLRPYVEAVAHRVYRGGWAPEVLKALRMTGRVDRVEHEIAAPEWPAGLRPLKMAFGSDFHAGPTTHPAVLEHACDLMARGEPDVLLLGGDFVYLFAHYIAPLTEALRRIEAPHGRYAVMGNHDLWSDDSQIVARLTDAGVRVLINENVTLAPPFDHVSICGLDEPYTGNPDAEKTFAGAAPVRVLLSHSPAGLWLVPEARFDVAFSGHTHGGHIALPGGRPIFMPRGPGCWDYPHGEFEIDHPTQGHIIVSRGVGGVDVPFRLFAPPDVRICNLGASQEQS